MTPGPATYPGYRFPPRSSATRRGSITSSARPAGGGADRRNATAAKRFFRRLLAGLKFPPDLSFATALAPSMLPTPVCAQRGPGTARPGPAALGAPACAARPPPRAARARNQVVNAVVRSSLGATPPSPVECPPITLTSMVGCRAMSRLRCCIQEGPLLGARHGTEMFGPGIWRGGSAVNRPGVFGPAAWLRSATDPRSRGASRFTRHAGAVATTAARSPHAPAASEPRLTPTHAVAKPFPAAFAEQLSGTDHRR